MMYIRYRTTRREPNPPSHAKVLILPYVPMTPAESVGSYVPNLNPLHAAEHLVATLYLAFR
jgi:hypothetical protein